MFERRLKMILWSLGMALAALVARAGQIQVVQRAHWTSEATDLLTQHKYIETTRGRILDCLGRVLAEDEPCMDACVAYPAVTEDWDQNAKWLREQATAAVLRQNGEFYKKAPLAQRQAMIDAESETIRAQVHAMWHALAVDGGKTDDEIADIRRAVIERVEERRHAVALRRFRAALGRRIDLPWYGRWWPSAAASATPEPDDYAVDVSEESEAYVVLPAISTEVYNKLARNAESMPGLVLRPGRQRVYPYKEAACHVIGSMAMVTGQQVRNDPNAKDDLREYWQSDLAGQDGVEKLCEQALRGTRGEETRSSSDEDWELSSEAIPGKDVVLSIDIELERDMEQAFVKPRGFSVRRGDHDVTQYRADQPGAAVVLDVATGRALALVSYPTYDLNTLKTEYAKLRVNDITEPLLDRTMDAAYEPGSTVKPLMALAALSDGLITPESTIPCTGYLVLGGKQYKEGRCWTMSEFNTTHMGTVDPMPSNNLNVVDAIERSCDVFFETVADRMKMDRQRYWYDRFGLGRPTGIGLPEASGLIPDSARVPAFKIVLATCFAGIGQGAVLTTPLQMANVAATIARGGTWMPPGLVEDGTPPRTVDLGFSAMDVAVVKRGMEAVANSAGGTGALPRGDGSDDLSHIRIAAKTGTAQASPLTVPMRDSQGQIVMENGRAKRVAVDPNDPAVYTWYIAADDANTHYAHHWYIGYAPADHPRIAFAIFAEYGGSGSPTANAIARDVLAACVKHGYLSGR
jgi:penicillin-binding protein 2